VVSPYRTAGAFGVAVDVFLEQVPTGDRILGYSRPVAFHATTARSRCAGLAQAGDRRRAGSGSSTMARKQPQVLVGHGLDVGPRSNRPVRYFTKPGPARPDASGSWNSRSYSACPLWPSRNSNVVSPRPGEVPSAGGGREGRTGTGGLHAGQPAAAPPHARRPGTACRDGANRVQAGLPGPRTAGRRRSGPRRTGPRSGEHRDEVTDHVRPPPGRPARRRRCRRFRFRGRRCVAVQESDERGEQHHERRSTAVPTRVDGHPVRGARPGTTRSTVSASYVGGVDRPVAEGPAPAGFRWLGQACVASGRGRPVVRLRLARLRKSRG